MFNLLYEYLLRYRALSLPGLGQLRIDSSNAQVDVTAQEIIPPVHQFHFEEGKFVRLQRVYNWLADRKQISEGEAVQLLNDFGQYLKEQLSAGNEVSWKGVGLFTRRDDGHIQFKSGESGLAFLQPVKATKVIHEGASHAMLVGETETNSKLMEARLDPYPFAGEMQKPRWWLIPLIVGLLGLLLLGWYCSQHGFTIDGAANTNGF